MAACVCDMFQNTQAQRLYFHLHLVTEGEKAERSVMAVKLLRLDWGSFGGPQRAGWRIYGLCL